MKRLLSVATLVVLTPSFGCGAVQRRAVGSAVAGLGAVTTATGMLMLTPQCQRDYDRGPCRTPPSPPRYERDGAQIFAVGLGTLVLGGIIYLTGTHLPQRHQRGEWHFVSEASAPFLKAPAGNAIVAG